MVLSGNTSLPLCVCVFLQDTVLVFLERVLEARWSRLHLWESLFLHILAPQTWPLCLEVIVSPYKGPVVTASQAASPLRPTSATWRSATFMQACYTRWAGSWVWSRRASSPPKHSSFKTGTRGGGTGARAEWTKRTAEAAGSPAGVPRTAFPSVLSQWKRWKH